MAKISFFILLALLSISIIAATDVKLACGRHGADCLSDSECCDKIKCNKYAKRCQVQITKEELMAAREKILKRKGKDY